MHLLALRISTYLSLRGDAVLKHWASAKIARSKPGVGEEADDDVCRVIVEKCGRDVSYAEIAKKAWEVGRTGLATKVNKLPSC
jgi:vacuolar protein sorting-associated protein 16